MIASGPHENYGHGLGPQASLGMFQVSLRQGFAIGDLSRIVIDLLIEKTVYRPGHNSLVGEMDAIISYRPSPQRNGRTARDAERGVGMDVLSEFTL